MKTREGNALDHIKELVAAFQSQLELQDMKIEVLGRSLNNIYHLADWDMYRQTLFHLVVNALKFRKQYQNNIMEKTVTIQVYTTIVKRELLDSNQVFLETVVIDSGIGMSEEILSKIKNSFTS